MKDRSDRATRDVEPERRGAVGRVVGRDRRTPSRRPAWGSCSALDPKNLRMCIGAGLTIGQANLDTEQSVLAVAVFTVIAASTVLLPVIAYAVAKDKMWRPLDELKAWLLANNAAVMGVLVLVIGTVLVGKGLGGLLRRCSPGPAVGSPAGPLQQRFFIRTG